MFVVGALFLYKTSWGRHVQAIGVSPRASFLSGIDIRLLPFILYVVTALATAFGGFVQMSRLDSAPPRSRPASSSTFSLRPCLEASRSAVAAAACSASSSASSSWASSTTA